MFNDVRTFTKGDKIILKFLQKQFTCPRFFDNILLQIVLESKHFYFSVDFWYFHVDFKQPILFDLTLNQLQRLDHAVAIQVNLW